MWPFPKKEPEIPVSERPMPPCGDKDLHYGWIDSSESRMSCPKCAALKEQDRQRMEENDYIDRLAVAIARELRKIL